MTRALVVLVGLAALAFTLLYGPSRRVFAARPRVVAVSSAAEAAELWEASGLRGRVLYVLSDRLAPARFGLTAAELAALGPDLDALERAMHHGVVREAVHVIPDARWPALARSSIHVTIYWPTATGLVGAFEFGRVHVIPAFRLARNGEPALLVVDAAAWSPPELAEIARRVRRGDLRTDLVAVVNGSAADVELLDAALFLR